MNFLDMFAILFLSSTFSQTLALTSIVLDEGDTLRIPCSYDSTTNQLMFWSKNDSTSGGVFSAISPYQDTDTRISFQRYHTINTLIIKNVTADDQGMYKCSVVDVSESAPRDTDSYDYGYRSYTTVSYSYNHRNYRCPTLKSLVTDIKIISLKITHSPFIIRAKSTTGEVKVVQGRDAELRCYAGGYPRPIVYWERANGSRIMSGGSKYPFEELQLQEVTQEDAGTYFCVADNSIGEAARMAVDVIVTEHEPSTETATTEFSSYRWKKSVD